MGSKVGKTVPVLRPWEISCKGGIVTTYLQLHKGRYKIELIAGRKFISREAECKQSSELSYSYSLGQSRALQPHGQFQKRGVLILVGFGERECLRNYMAKSASWCYEGRGPREPGMGGTALCFR